MAADVRVARKRVRRAHPALLFIALAVMLSGCTWTVRASVNSMGIEGNGASLEPALSGDGRYVMFESNASNLVPGDTNNRTDIFVRDNRTGAVERVNVSSSGATQANGDSRAGDISKDGRYVSFTSTASNLVPGDTNGHGDVFVHDRVTGVTERVTPDALGVQLVDTELSADGRYVLFVSGILYRADRVTHTVTQVGGCVGESASLSDDGRYVAYDQACMSSNAHSAVVFDVQTSKTTALATASLVDTEPVISGNGRFVAYQRVPYGPPETEYIEIRVRDLQTGTDEFVNDVSPGLRATVQAISADGRYVAFETEEGVAPDDTNGQDDIYVADSHVGFSVLVVRSAVGKTAPEGGSDADMSADGRYVAFDSFASDLVPDDTNGAADVFVRATPTPESLSVTPASLVRGTTTIVHVRGAYLLPSSQVRVSGDGVAVGSVTWVSREDLAVSVTVASDAATGRRTVIVSLPGTGPGPGAGAVGACSGCLTVR